MRYIDIITSQKVTISYQLATLRDRALAWFIDIVIIVAFIYLLVIIGVLIAYTVLQSSQNLVQYFLYIVVLPIFIFYSLLNEIFLNGQSLGKMAIGIKVVKLNGRKVTVFDYLIRWTFRMIDIYMSLGSIAIILCGSSVKGQRLGDLLANTTLIKIRNNRTFSLKEILSIRSKEDYTPVYTDVKNLNDEEMLLIKSIVDRFTQHPNDAHKAIVNELSQSLAAKLDVELPADKIDFLKTLLKDYIVLTR